mmetsp:Transcript_3358/g.6099  ORF Transcript_3358/g.6099 Transcript_3358/m.6099 type:complete len:329 (+) Transcript_3358:62-1048(+)
MEFEQCIEIQGEESVELQVGLNGLKTTSSVGLLFIHGMGSCGATWHNQITQLSPFFLTICPDLRGHGFSGDCSSLDMDLLVKDIIHIITTLQHSVIGRRKIILIGHSVGASIATFAAHALTTTHDSLLGGVVCLDMAEGTALAALPHMKAMLDTWPKSFPSIDSCVDWSVRHHHPTSVCSAEKSIPPTLRRIPSDSGSNSSPDCEGPYFFRTSLRECEANWESWFVGFNAAFLNLSKLKTPHILLLSTPERMDNELTVANMQGKFQLKLIQGGCGEHFLHEDQPDQTVAILTNFIYTSGYISQKELSTIMSHSLFAHFPTHDFHKPTF